MRPQPIFQDKPSYHHHPYQRSRVEILAKEGESIFDNFP